MTWTLFLILYLEPCHSGKVHQDLCQDRTEAAASVVTRYARLADCEADRDEVWYESGYRTFGWCLPGKAEDRQ